MSRLRVEPGKPVVRYLYVRAAVDRLGEVTFPPFAVVTSTDDLRIDRTGDGDPYTFALAGEGQHLVDATVDLPGPACSTEDEAISLVSAFLPLPENVAGLTLTLSRNSEEVASVPLDLPAPTVALETMPAAGATAAGRQELSWSSAGAGGSPVGHSVWYSPDEGLTWWPLAVGFEGTAVSVDFDQLPGGQAAQLRITAVCGAAEGEARSEPFVVDPPGVAVAIHEPEGEPWPTPGAPLRVRASARIPPDGPTADPSSFRWLSDLDGDLGYGPERTVVLHRPGKHTLSVVFTAGDGSTATASRAVTVTRAAERFLHVARKGSIKDTSTVLDHPSLAGRPEAIVLVTPIWNPGGGTGVYNDHPVGTRYDGAAWRIFNQDQAPMPEGAGFVVDVLDPGPSAFVHAGEPSANSTYLSHPLADGRDDALVLVTANWNPGGGAGIYNAQPTGVWFDVEAKRWAVFNQTGSPMPAGAAFNVEVLPPAMSVWAHVADDGNVTGNATRLSHPDLDGKPDALLQVSPIWNRPGKRGVYLPHHVGAWYDGGHWNVFTQDERPMPLGAAFAISS